MRVAYFGVGGRALHTDFWLSTVYLATLYCIIEFTIFRFFRHNIRIPFHLTKIWAVTLSSNFIILPKSLN